MSEPIQCDDVDLPGVEAEADKHELARALSLFDDLAAKLTAARHAQRAAEQDAAELRSIVARAFDFDSPMTHEQALALAQRAAQALQSWRWQGTEARILALFRPAVRP